MKSGFEIRKEVFQKLNVLAFYLVRGVFPQQKEVYTVLDLLLVYYSNLSLRITC